MKQVLQQLAAYNAWANQQMADCICNLSDDQVHREIASSFPSVFRTLLHLWDAESIWWQRLKLAEQIEVPGNGFREGVGELCKRLLMQSRQWEEWVAGATENQLNHVFAYQNTKRELFKQPVNEVLVHLFNHGTYHRGQLVTLLRQLGVVKIPQTDFIVYCRKK
jgi:uncharacterized damage-inducible protein DinB